GASVAGIDLTGNGVLHGDVTDRDAISAAVGRAAERLGGIDILINNAGIGSAHDAGAFPDASARRILDVNFFGAWNTTAAAMGYLLASGGRVVNISSGLAFVDLPFAAAYSASKRALDAYSAALALEYRGRISVVTVHPGYVRTKIHDASRAQGVALEGIVRADTVDKAASAIVRACATGRPGTTSLRSRVELTVARRLPRLAGWAIDRKLRRHPQKLLTSLSESEVEGLKRSG
ncbi:MAG: SDR family NAD(P)-dependent oxidoreductase, partial [Actinomycetota bacterium]